MGTLSHLLLVPRSTRICIEYLPSYTVLKSTVAIRNHIALQRRILHIITLFTAGRTGPWEFRSFVLSGRIQPEKRDFLLTGDFAERVSAAFI